MPASSLASSSGLVDLDLRPSITAPTSATAYPPSDPFVHLAPQLDLEQQQPSYTDYEVTSAFHDWAASLDLSGQDAGEQTFGDWSASAAIDAAQEQEQADEEGRLFAEFICQQEEKVSIVC